ncbi:ABC transporter permease [Candidatus Woesearchaeota archaeon]|nr:ABC transporter permease [Candidatus Woesearchaeota archaeon]
MKFHKCLKHAFSMVVHSKLRSWLTILGIVIGVASVIAIVSIGEGMKAEMEAQMSSMAGDILTLSAGYSRGTSMFGPPGGGRDGGPGNGGGARAEDEEVVVDKSDVQALKSIPEIFIISPQIRGTAEISYLGESGDVSVTGIDQKVWSQITTDELKEGRFLDSADKNVIVIGSRLAESFFDHPLGINQMLTIEGRSFRIVGILNDDSRSIYMPIQAAYQIIDDKDIDVYDSITIKIADEEKLNETMEKIEKKLRNTRHVTAKTQDFSLTSSKLMAQTRSEMMSTMSNFLLAIAAVSLIVGAVGVANTMFTSVLEKTKDIGIMKAIGARNRDIMTIFLLNSALIGLAGGLLGIVFGSMLSSALPALVGSTSMLRGGTLVSLNSVLLAIAVSVGVGVIAGAIPAYKASKLKPVDALRYE